MSTKVEFIYDLDCPNVQEARQALLRAFAELNTTARWTEWNRGSPESPAYARQYGSPTVLVNGRDVTGTEPLRHANCCRIYWHGAAGLRSAPPVLSIVAALRRANHQSPKPVAGAARWRHSLTALPGIGSALLPVGGCPACWPVYSAVLASLGLTFLFDSAIVLGITLTFLGVALLALAFRAKARKSYGPLILGAVSAGIILFFKFAWMIAWLVYLGFSGLVIASFWSALPGKMESPAECSACAKAGRQQI